MRCFWWGHIWYVANKGWFYSANEGRKMYGVNIRCKVCDKRDFSTWFKSISDERALHLMRR